MPDTAKSFNSSEPPTGAILPSSSSSYSSSYHHHHRLHHHAHHCHYHHAYLLFFVTSFISFACFNGFKKNIWSILPHTCFTYSSRFTSFTTHCSITMVRKNRFVPFEKSFWFQMGYVISPCTS